MSGPSPIPPGEFGLIGWIRAHTTLDPNRFPIGIGDDCASIRWPEPRQCLVTIDMLLEGRHFDLAHCTLTQVGRKAMGASLSDIAAMGGRPVAAFVSVALTAARAREQAGELYAGLRAMACEFDCAVAGGDTTAWDGPLVIDVAVVGEAPECGPIQRRGAQVGDWILATGEFGGSLAGRHVEFVPRVREVAALVANVPVHAMIDVSDGLGADLGHILEASACGAVLDEARVPVSAAAHEMSRTTGRSPLDHALSDGEDYELVFTLAPDDARRLLERPPFQTRLTSIGEITPGTGLHLRSDDGTVRPIEARGYDHLRPDHD